jgi:hypothetical protein
VRRLFSPSSHFAALLTLALALVLGGPAALAAQAPMGDTGPFGDVVGGIHGTDPGIHAFGGVGGGVFLRPRVGIEGMALGGAGGSYSSVFLGAGPSVRLVSRPGGELRAWGGPAWYRESLSGPVGGSVSPDPRSMLAGALGLVGRIPAGPVHLSAGVLAWHGSVSADGFAASASTTGVRFLVGVGR